MEGGSQKTKVGLTLIEFLVVISIISFLATLTLAAVSSARAKARDAKRVSDMRSIITALELYHNDHGRYPDESATCTGPTDGPVYCENTGNRGWECSHINYGSPVFIPCVYEGGHFLEQLVPKYLANIPEDPLNDDSHYYAYERAASGKLFNCGSLSPPIGHYSLAIKKFETDFAAESPNPCGLGSLYTNAFDWIYGSSE